MTSFLGMPGARQEFKEELNEFIREPETREYFKDLIKETLGELKIPHMETFKGMIDERLRERHNVQFIEGLAELHLTPKENTND